MELQNRLDSNHERLDSLKRRLSDLYSMLTTLHDRVISFTNLNGQLLPWLQEQSVNDLEIVEPVYQVLQDQLDKCQVSSHLEMLLISSFPPLPLIILPSLPLLPPLILLSFPSSSSPSLHPLLPPSLPSLSSLPSSSSPSLHPPSLCPAFASSHLWSSVILNFCFSSVSQWTFKKQVITKRGTI